MNDPTESLGWAPEIVRRAGELFPTDRPLAANEMIGRDDEVAVLVEALNDGNHRALTGADQAGKTSIALAAAAQLGAEWTVVGVDLFRIPSPDHLIRAMVDGRPQVADAELDAPARSIGAAIRQLDVEAADDGRRLLLLVDGFHELATTQIFGKLAEVGADMRASLDATTHTVGLFVGGAATVMRDLFTSKKQPFHQLAAVTTLPPVETTAWRTGLGERFDLGGCPAGDGALDRLVDVGEQHARSTMLIAQHAYVLAMAAGHRTLNVEAVEAGLESALSGERSLADHRLAQVRSLSKHALTTALRVATGESPYKNLPPAMARQTLRSLETAGVVDHPKSGVYTIGNPLLRRSLVALSTATSTTMPNVEPQPERGHPVMAAYLAQVSQPTPPAPPVAAPAVAAASDEHPPDESDPRLVTDRTPLHQEPEQADTRPAGDESPKPSVPSPPTRPAAEPTPEPVSVETLGSAAAGPEPGNRDHMEAAIDLDLASHGHVVVEAGSGTIAAEFVVDNPATGPEQASAPVAPDDSTAGAEPTATARSTTERRHFRLRHPHRDEADEVHHCVTQALDPDPSPQRSRDSRLGRYVRHAIVNDPDQYWQVEAGKRPVGGVVLHEPRGATRPGLDPLSHAAMLGASGALLVVGLVMLVVERAWNWGAYAGLIFAAFIAAFVHLVQIAPRVIARAKASLAARRRGGQIVAAVWSEPDALADVFHQLATELPGKHLTGYIDSPDHAAAFRDVGFTVRRNRIAEGVLDPRTQRPVRPPTDAGNQTPAARRRSHGDLAADPPARTATSPRPRAATQPSSAYLPKHRRHSHNKRRR